MTVPQGAFQRPSDGGSAVFSLWSLRSRSVSLFQMERGEQKPKKEVGTVTTLLHTFPWREPGPGSTLSYRGLWGGG